ncbi:MAG: hypothetical protein P8X65_02260 [Syntrophobacterales bacterium]
MTEKKEKRYEKPELKTLFNDLQAAVGQCNAGINDINRPLRAVLHPDL